MAKTFLKNKFFLFLASLFAGLGIIFLAIFTRHSKIITNLTNNYWVFTTVNQLAKITDIPFLVFNFKSHSLPRYQLQIDELEFLNLEASLPDPTQTSLVQSFATQIPATFTSDQGKSYSVKLKIRGNNATHWAYDKKSYRLTFPKDNHFKDLPSIDLIIPEDRGLVLEHLANFRAKKLGLLAPDSWFATVTINQNSPSLYFISEKLDQDFFERKNSSGTLFGENDDIDNWNQDIYESSEHWRAYPDKKKNPDWQHLDQLLSLINDPSTTSKKLLELLDLDSFLSWQAHSVLMNSLHQDQSHNNRLFFNHQLKKFILIPWDTGQREMVSQNLTDFTHPITDILLKNPEILEKRNQLLLSYLNSDKPTKDIEFIQKHLDQIYLPLLQDQQKFYPNLKYLNDIKNYRVWAKNHFTVLQDQLN